jgi:tetratricopeptide (TPR) repeat protein
VSPTGTKAVSLLSSPANRAIYSETFFPRFHYGWSDLHSLIEGTHQYIQGPQPELYDLAADPGEKRNLIDAERRRAFAMRASIAPFVTAAAAPAAVSPEEARKLAALGYIGSSAPAEGELPDPKDKVGMAGELRKAFALYEKGEYEAALPLFQKLIAENERMLDVWDVLARTLDRLGRTEEAITAAKRAFRLSPNTTHLALMIAALSLDVGRLDEAQKHAELAVDAEPGRAHSVLARIAMARGDVPGAEREAKLALESRDQVFALLTLGRIELDRKNLPAALSYSDRAIAFVRDQKGSAVKGMYFLRGDVLARSGQTGEAEAAFRKEIELFPRDAQAYKNLILLLVSEGRNDEATKLVFQLVGNAPIPPSYVAISTTLGTIGDERGARYWAAEGLKKFPRDATLRKLARG